MSIKALLHLIFAFLIATPALAQTPEPVTLEPMDLLDAELVVIGADGTEKRYTPEQLETLTTYRLRTTTPWRPEPADFDGILLSDVLRESGLHDVAAIRVTAENDFGSTLQRALWENVPVLVATRVNGQPHSRRERGPIQFVIGADDYTSSGLATEAHLVWMAARIEAE